MNSSARSNWAVRAGIIFLALCLAAPVISFAGRDGGKLRIIFTSDTRGKLRRCGCSEGQMGGISARAAFVKSNYIDGCTLVLDAGDTFFGEPVASPAREGYNRLKMRAITDAMDLARTDASSVGEYDLAAGLDAVEDTAVSAKFPFLSANIKRDTLACWNRAPFEGSAVIEAAGLRVGIIGVADSGFPYRDFPESMSDVEVQDTIKNALYELRRIRENSDIIVILAHLSFMTPRELADGLGGGADIIIQGHSQGHMTEPDEYNGTLILQGYDKGKHIGVLDLAVGEAKEITAHEFSVYPLTESLPLDPGVEGLLDGYRARLKEESFDFAVPDPEGEGGYAGTEACIGCHEDEYAAWLATPHSWAFDALVRTADDYDPECLVCHVTGYGFESGYRTGDTSGLKKNVGCEMCHGRGGGHIMRQNGIIPIKKGSARDAILREVPEDVCRRCHDEENSSAFEYETYLNMGGDHTVTGY